MRCNSQSGPLCTSEWRLYSFAWSGYLACLLACFGFARVHPPLRFPRFRWPLRGPFGWSGFCWLPLGFGLSCLFWGSPCVSPGCLLFAVGLFVPGGGRALEWFVAGAACCWRGRFWLLALLLLLPQLLCAVYLGGSSVQSLHTSPVPRGVFCNSAIKAAESDHEMVVQSLVQTRQELRDQVSLLFYQWLGIHKGPCEAGGW